MFDTNGEYIGVLAASGLSAPESITVLGARPGIVSEDEDSFLLITDGNRLLYLDAEAGQLQEAGVVGNERQRLLGAAAGVNGTIFAANWTGNEVQALTPMDEVTTGLQVQINRIAADSFPQVTAEISVRNRLNWPIVGLDHNNFVLTEQNRPVANQTLAGSSWQSPEFALSILIERSPSTEALRDSLAAAVRDLAAGLEGTQGRIASIVSAGRIPENARFDISSPRSLENAAKNGSFSPQWRFDLGLRLATGSLLSGPAKRAIFYVTAGSLGEAGAADFAFEQYGLSELAGYMANNGVVFNVVLVGQEDADEKTRYLADETGGSVMRLYQEEGVFPAVKAMADAPSGDYILTYTSALDSGLGENFLPLEAQVYYLERSGRDTAGYFAPLE
jgi:hypothetical protein